jgi:8-oxo-dGTP pyrophosphatase MutT (NUDIX family)
VNAFSAADFRIRAVSHAAFTDEYGDYMLNPAFEADMKAARYKDAAVLIGLRERGGECSVILTERTAHLATHAGQVAFPGGKIDPDDTSPEAAALREAHEEIGLDPSACRTTSPARATGSNPFWRWSIRMSGSRRTRKRLMPYSKRRFPI